jgi:hypothetical protein
MCARIGVASNRTATLRDKPGCVFSVATIRLAIIAAVGGSISKDTEVSRT